MKSMDSYAASGKWHDEYKKYIELEGEIYCSSCVEIMNKNSKYKGELHCLNQTVSSYESFLKMIF